MEEGLYINTRALGYIILGKNLNELSTLFQHPIKINDDYSQTCSES